ncbi:MAG: DNA-binding protein, partial [Gammaproteobacteria bacterium]|nr:DNA-binding protein [Gammaproteobacteria bacterium]
MPTIAVIGSSRTPPDHPDYRDAQRLGRLLAEAGFTVASGGYGGLMEAVSQGARSVGGPVVGVTAPDVFPGRAGVNEYVTDEQPAETL